MKEALVESKEEETESRHDLKSFRFTTTNIAWTESADASYKVES